MTTKEQYEAAVKHLATHTVPRAGSRHEGILPEWIAYKNAIETKVRFEMQEEASKKAKEKTNA